jgi:Co/Zn/Cd efflux system component
MTFGDLVRGIGLMMGYLFATFNVGSASWFDIALSWSTCAFILSSVFPIFVRTGNILLNRAPMDPLANHNIEKMVKAVVLETGVVDIQKQHYWVQTDGMVVGSISVLVDRSVDEQVITDRIHEIFRPMCFYVFTVEVQKEQMVL